VIVKEPQKIRTQMEIRRGKEKVKEEREEEFKYTETGREKG
jgi:hypothetical protein